MLNVTSLSAKLAPADFLSEDDGPAAKPYRIKICNVIENSNEKLISFFSLSHLYPNTHVANRRVKDVEISVPVVRTIAFYLVVFQLDPSFNNPTRVVNSPPFELSECGWGEFEIVITHVFHNDVCDKQLDLWVVVTPVENMNEKERGDTKDHPLSHRFLNFSEADELLKLAAVQAHIIKLRRQMNVIDGLPQGPQLSLTVSAGDL
ncbi:hypothetical protein P3X46_029191 [Hevea brasiliensis]|uniref:YEATS domain-containing protein n=1 Tax=Hevea brasiliensis TaxID=3981 RepID=A0ABQ9KSA3_HEVBR|nr:hypothetical protein P3X46_029191 [Hevea brasiliensis]